MSAYNNQIIGPRIFIAALFIMAKNEKLPICPSRLAEVNKFRYNHTMEYYTKINKIKEKKIKELLIDTMALLNLTWTIWTEELRHKRVSRI